MPWILNQEERMFWGRLQVIMTLIRNGEILDYAATLECISFDATYDRVWLTHVNVLSYGLNEQFQERRVRNQFHVLRTW